MTVVRLADYRGLETRGVRPDPMLRGSFAVYAFKSIDRSYRAAMQMAVAHGVHMAFWGVPCGPTLSMIPGRSRLRGITATLADL